MKRLLLAVLLLAGCTTGGTPATKDSYIRYTHDDVHKVSCWYFSSAMHCLPDAQVVNPGDPTQLMEAN
jgi:hypothetical protein